MANVQHIFKVAGPPSSAPTGSGHHYVDTLNNISYISKGTATVADWVQVGGGGGGTWGSITGTLSDQTDLQTELDGKQNTISANNNQFIYQNNSGVIEGLPNWYRDTNLGGLNFSITGNPNNGTGFTVHGHNINVEPLQNSPNESYNIHNVQINSDNADSGFSFGTAGTAYRVWGANVVHNGSGNLGEINLISNNFSVGNGTDPITFRGFSYAYGFGAVNANVNITGAMQGYGFQPNINASATITAATSYINAFYDGTIVGCAMGNYVSFSAGPTIASIQNNCNYSGLNLNSTITTFTGNANYNGIVVSGTFGTFDTGGWTGININPTITMVNYAQGIYVSMDNVTVYAGTASTLVIQDLTITFSQVGDNNSYQVEYLDDTTAGSETAGLAGQLITVHMEDGVSTATQIKTAIEANFTLNSNLTITVSGVGSNPQNAQAATNFISGTNPGNKKAAYFDGDVEITGALAFGGALSIGKLDAFFTQALTDGGGTPSSVHSLITAPTVAANVTLTSGDLLGVNTAALITIGDNATVGTAFLGVAALGLPAVLSMGTGSTVDRVYGAVFALSLDGSATGGTVDEVGLCRAIAIPNGTTTVTTLMGYKFDLPFGDPGTTTWGVYMTPACNNYFAGNLLIGGTAGSDDTVTNSSVAFEIKSTTKALLNARMTTTERNALTAVNGMQIYNTTTDKLQVYAAGSWVDLH
jgi:hypothetical protein